MTRESAPRATARPPAGRSRPPAQHPMRPPPPEPTVRGQPPQPQRPERPQQPAPNRPGQADPGTAARPRQDTAAAAGTADVEAPERRGHPGGSHPGGSHAARDQAVRAYRRRGRRRLAVLLGSVLGAAWLAYLLLLGSAFGARTVDVAGAGLLSADEVRAAAGVPAGHPLLRLDLGAVADRVRALPPVAEVVVQRSWPSTVTIRITERVPLAYAPAGAAGTGAQLVDATGLWFATVAAPPPGLPRLHAADGAATAAAAAVLATLADPAHQGVRAELVSVQADSPLDIRLGLRGERTVRWGSAEASPRKAGVLAVLLSQPGTVYDVASPELPTIR